jgi:ADP-heptose:LPS heptosyltransferase
MQKKIKNLLLLALCLAYSIRKGKANRQASELKKVVIIQTGKLGDMVCTTPMFRAIKNKYPGCKVYVVGNRINQELLEGNEFVDGYIVFEKNPFELRKKLKEHHFDAGFSAGPNFQSLAALYLSDIPLITVPEVVDGVSPYENKSYKILRNLVMTKPHSMISYAPGEYLRLLQSIGIHTQDTQKNLNFSPEALRRVNEFFGQSNIDRQKDILVGISPSAGNKIKVWPAARFAQVANTIYKEYGAKIVIIGSPVDKDEIAKMLSHIDSGVPIINTYNMFSVDELKALIAQLNVFISVDSGPIYVAEAFGVPTIDIVGPVDEKVQPPIGKKHRVVFADVPGRPFLSIMNARVYDIEGAKMCTEKITVDMVMKEFKELFPTH